jgi:peptidoglycan-associated lipoprotein
MTTSKIRILSHSLYLGVFTILLTACANPVDLDTTDKPSDTTPFMDNRPTDNTQDVYQNQEDTVELQTIAPLERVIYFDFDSFVITTSQYRGVIAENAAYLKADRTRQVTLEGHTDSRGSREYNLALGQKRAETVQNALQILGVSPNQIEAISYGEERPADTEQNELAWSLNRRVIFSYR